MRNETKQTLAWAALPLAAVANGAAGDFTRLWALALLAVAVASLLACRRRGA